jgi:hypothetical protein
MPLADASDFLLERSEMEGWAISEESSDYVEASYVVRSWFRYARVWRINVSEYLGMHNYWEDPY